MLECELTYKYMAKVTELQLQLAVQPKVGESMTTQLDREAWFEERYMTEVVTDAITTVMAEGIEDTDMEWCFGYHNASGQPVTDSLVEWRSYQQSDRYTLVGTCKVRITYEVE